jgi:hypothetical protein
MDLDEASFRQFVLERLVKAGLVAGVQDDDQPDPVYRTRKPAV